MTRAESIQGLLGTAAVAGGVWLTWGKFGAGLIAAGALLFLDYAAERWRKPS